MAKKVAKKKPSKRAERLAATVHTRQLDLATDTGLKNAREKFGRRLRARRLELGLTQTDIALACDMAQTSVGVAEEGKFTPKFAQLLMMARALKSTLSELLAGVRL